MKACTLGFSSVVVLSLFLSCGEKGKRTDHQTPDGTQRADQTSRLSTKDQSDSQYGELDQEGFPTNPGLGMNSDRISEEQRLQLRQQPPNGYHIGAPVNTSFIEGRASDIAWRRVQAGTSDPGTKKLLARLLEMDEERLPPSVDGDEIVLKSPLGTRVIVQAPEYSDSALLFELKNGVAELATFRTVHRINFDDKRRAFIDWIAFIDESVIVGQLADDEDVEDLPSRNTLYIYDIDKATLSRVNFPEGAQDKISPGFVIDSVAESGALLIKDGKSVLTVYLR